MLSSEPKVEAGNNYRDLYYLPYNNCFFILIHRFEENNDKDTVARNLN